MSYKKSIKLLCQDNDERVKSYDFKVKTLRKLGDFRVNEDLLDDLAKLQRTSPNYLAVVKGLQGYLLDIEKKLADVIESKILSEFMVEVIVLVIEQVKLVNGHYDTVKTCLAKEKAIPEHHPENHVRSYYIAFKKEVKSSENVISVSVVEKLETIFDDIKSNLDKYESLLEKGENFSESEIIKLKDIYSRYLADGEPYEKLKEVYKITKYTNTVISLLKTLISAESKVIYKWTHN